MARITKVTIENYRVFHGHYELNIPEGRNLLLYGENGSGKSSLFMAIREWMKSSDQKWAPSSFQKELNLKCPENSDPLIRIEIASPDVQAVYECKPEHRTTTNRQVIFMRRQLSYFTYRTLLRLSFIQKNNLFSIAMSEILGDIRIGESTKTISGRWKSLQELRTAWDSSEFKRKVRTDIPALNDQLKILIQNELQPIVNKILDTYFPASGVKVVIGTPSLRLGDRKRIGDGTSSRSFQGAEMKVSIEFDGTALNDHNLVLNEARLNAIALAIFLGGRIIRNRLVREHSGILLLDDIFIGLDTSNRIPLLKLLTADKISFTDKDGEMKEYPLFRDYQIFLSTYDRHWYETAKHWFESRYRDSWQFAEMYVNHGAHDTNSPNDKFDKPILIGKTLTELEKGILYLCDVEKPDYPAAANCFRRVYEALIKKHIPSGILRGANSALIPEFKIRDRSKATINFLQEVGENAQDFIIVHGFIGALLHPLSHGIHSVTPYKGELMEVMNALIRLSGWLENDRLKDRYKVILDQGKCLEMRYQIPPNLSSTYWVKLKRTAILFERDGALKITESPCEYDRVIGFQNGQEVVRKTFDHQDSDIAFNTLEECYNETHRRMATGTDSRLHGCIKEPNYIDAIFVRGRNGVVRSIRQFFYNQPPTAVAPAPSSP